MKEIIHHIEEQGSFGLVKGVESIILNAALKFLKETAINKGRGKELYSAINNYHNCFERAKHFLSKGEIEEIERRYEEIQEIWTGPEYRGKK